MDIVNYSHSQCHPLDPKNNRKTLLASPIGVTTPATVRHRTPVTATVTSRDYYQNQQRPSDIAYTPMTFESNYFSNTCDYATVDSKNTINNNNNNNNHTKTSDFYELESKMYQEMNSYYHNSHHRTCAGYNVPPAAYEMRSFGSMATASATPSVHTAPAPPLPPLPLPMPMYQRQHHETRVQQSPTIRSNYNSTAASTSSSTTDDWYQPLYMNNRFDF